jgi:hypothetical protein
VLAYPLHSTLIVKDALQSLGQARAQAGAATWGEVATALLVAHSSLPGTIVSPRVLPPSSVTMSLPAVTAPVREMLVLGGVGTRIVLLDVEGVATVFDASAATPLFSFPVGDTGTGTGTTTSSSSRPGAVGPSSRSLTDLPRDILVLSRPGDVDGDVSDSGSKGDCLVLNLTSLGLGVHLRDVWQFGVTSVLPCRLTPTQQESAAVRGQGVNGSFVAGAVLALVTRHLLVAWEHGGGRVIVFDGLSGAALAWLQQPHGAPLVGGARAVCAPALHYHPPTGHVVAVWGRQTQGAAVGTVVTLWDVAPVQWVAEAIRCWGDRQHRFVLCFIAWFAY